MVWHASLLGKRLKKAWRVPLVFVLDSRERNRRAINEEQLNQAIKSDFISILLGSVRMYMEEQDILWL